ncbi:MAG: DUF5675 family protein [Candidatus Acidiferrales bacterium]
MKLELQRDVQTGQGTTGQLFLDGAPFCFTLERPAARFGDPHPCIPAGEYRVTLYHSPHFGRMMPLLADVPGRDGIEIHWGNYVENTDGCILVGSSTSLLADGNPAIWNSRETFDKLFAAIDAALARRAPGQAEGCTITIRLPQLTSAHEIAIDAQSL